ncbi:hypothetical protein KDK_59020 [Dictyobacter kobayashii]|uniref:Uncharacterized protein n=1 Tax=Dictyobacter kobayashii TaxID=2014872 RepID=A0A402ASP1_9CHLR|nr:hypothetical protein KDK_59020 [Dictyobacter kobayashii]
MGEDRENQVTKSCTDYLKWEIGVKITWEKIKRMSKEIAFRYHSQLACSAGSGCIPNGDITLSPFL